MLYISAILSEHCVLVSRMQDLKHQILYLSIFSVYGPRPVIQWRWEVRIVPSRDWEKESIINLEFVLWQPSLYMIVQPN